MCEPTLILSAVAGGAQAITGIQQQNAQYRAQVAEVNRSNAMAKQDYINKLNIASHDDQLKGRQFEAELKAAASAKTAYWKQKEINQIEQARASTAAQLELQEKVDSAALQGQTQLAESIRAQGSILASGMQAGQSMFGELQQAERELGFAQAEIDAGLWNAERQYGMKEYDIALSKYSADASAISQLDGGPTLAPSASFAPVKPIMKEPPSKPSALGAIMGGVSTGMSTYVGTKGYRKS
tara:strand:- start:7608 stop:8327 length:720 start_codon:yes stop_codon:yes gene_type:complete